MALPAPRSRCPYISRNPDERRGGAAAARSFALCWALAVCVACSGAIGKERTENRDEGRGEAARDDDLPALDPDDPAVAAGVAFSCARDAEPPPEPMRRLSDRQYRNTVRDLVFRLLGEESVEARAVLAALTEALSEFPDSLRKELPHEPHGSYRRLDLDVQQSLVAAAYKVAVAASRALTDSKHIERVVGGCAVNSDREDDERCLSDFIERFGRLALRRPPTADERDFYRGIHRAGGNSPSEAYAELVGTFLMAPQFLFHVESGAAPVGDSSSVYELTPWEVASRLSYQFWDTMPDESLFEAAASGRLDDPESYAEEVERIFRDPRTREVMRTFVSDWLRLDEVPDPYQRRNEPIFKAFAADDVPTAGLRDEIVDEVLDTIGWLVFEKGRPVADLVLDDHILVRGAALARNYGVSPWDGQSEPARFPAGERPGLITRAAFHVHGSANTRPVMKGVFVRKQLLCDELPAPPADVVAEEPVSIEGKSTRQVVEAITEQPGTVCISCHASLLNPIGFATENIDALGRLRRQQDLFDESGEVTATIPVLTRATPQIALGDLTEVDGPEGLADLIAASGKVEACLARQYFRFSFGRWDSLEADGCTLERMRRKATGAGSAADLLREIAFAPAFRRRFIP